MKHSKSMKLRKTIIVSLIITVVIGAIWFTVGITVLKNAIESDRTRRPGSRFEDFARTGCFDTQRFARLKKTNISIASKMDGCLLSGTLIYNSKPSTRTIIFVHRITSTRWELLKGGRIDSLLARGFNVLTYDQRAHGQSEGQAPSYGFLEKYDLDQWVDTLASIIPNGIVGVEGVSTGAATAILHAGEINPSKEKSHKVSFYVVESSYSDLAKQLKYRINKEYDLPDMALTTSLKILDKPFSNFSIHKVSPLKAAPYIDVPIMFVHSKADTYVPSAMSQELYQATHAPKVLLLVPKSNHAEVNLVPCIYWKNHDAFLRVALKSTSSARPRQPQADKKVSYSKK